LAIKSAGVFLSHTVDIAKNVDKATLMSVRIQLLLTDLDLVAITPISKETTNGYSNVLRHYMSHNLLLCYVQEQLYLVLYSIA